MPFAACRLEHVFWTATQGLVRVFDSRTIEEAAADEQRSVQDAAAAVLLDLEMVAKHAPRLLKASLLTPA